MAQLEARQASLADWEVVTSITTLAFADDPLWSRAMARTDGGTDHHARFWRLFVEGALRYPWVWLTVGGEATSIWIPPGERRDERGTGRPPQRACPRVPGVGGGRLPRTSNTLRCRPPS